MPYTCTFEGGRIVLIVVRSKEEEVSEATLLQQAHQTCRRGGEGRGGEGRGGEGRGGEGREAL